MKSSESSILTEELERLEKMTGVNTGCNIVWIPKVKSEDEGEVRDKTIYIYSCSLEKAVHTLRHEFFDILVCQASKPYVDLVNTLLSVISQKTYQKKEEVVEMLVSLCECHDTICFSLSAKNKLTVV